jgi:hypothetical protein
MSENQKSPETNEATAENEAAKLARSNKARLLSFSTEKSTGRNKPFNLTTSHLYITDGDKCLVSGTLNGIFYYKSYSSLETASVAVQQLNQQYFD